MKADCSQDTGTHSHVHVIAEAGTNHGGDEQTALRLVDAACAAGADSVKFQLIYPEGLYLREFFRDGSYEANEVFAQRQAAALPDEAYRRLAEYCLKNQIPFTSTVFDQRGIRLMDELDVAYIKMASCDLNNSRLLVAAAETGRRLIVSTGMASLGEIERATIDILATGNSDIVLMHCVSVYPCSTDQMNLTFLRTLQQAFGLPVGLSDHSENSLAAAIAVSMGASWIEKHFTLDRTAPGFDHSYAIEPGSLASFVQDVRAAEVACSPRPAKVGEVEQNVKSRARRSIYAAHDLEQGAVVHEQDLLVVRPESYLAPNDLPLVVGRRTNRRVARFEPLSLDVLC